MAWFDLAEKFFPSTRSKFIAAISIALVSSVYAFFKDLPASWLPSSEPETFLIRLLLTLVVACSGIVATFISVVCDYNTGPNLKEAINEARGRVRQNEIDDLAEDLSWAIHNLLNKPVSSEGEVSQWELEFRAWCEKVSKKLENRAAFTRADQLHFDRLGFVPPANFAGSFNQHHERLISQLKLKFERLREILKK